MNDHFKIFANGLTKRVIFRGGQPAVFIATGVLTPAGYANEYGLVPVRVAKYKSLIEGKA